MDNVADYAAEFARRAKAGAQPTITVEKQHVETFLGFLVREGFNFARSCLDSIADPELRQIIEALFFSTLAGTATGAAIGGALAGPAGAQVGAVVGAATGLAIGCVALTLKAQEKSGALKLSLA